MKKILFTSVIFLLVAIAVQAQSTSTIRISGYLPIEEDLSMKLYGTVSVFEPIEIPVIDGHFDIEIADMSVGEYRLILSLPISDTSVYRDREGVVKEMPQERIGRIKSFYIHPDQSDHYRFILENPMSVEEFKALKQDDLLKTEVFYLAVESTSVDSQLHEELQRLNDEYRSNYAWIRDSLYAAGTQPDKIPADFTREANAINLETFYPVITNRKLDVIARNPESPVGPWAILNITNNELRQDTEAYQTLLDHMHGRARESSYYEKAKLKLAALSKIQEGNILEMPGGLGPDGEQVAYDPSDYAYTLVEFWASWCYPCRETNPRWNAILDTYQDTGFQILGVSLDENAEDWRKAIDTDQLAKWVHISDLEHPVTGGNAVKYGIEFIPFNLLLDRDGRILRKNIKPTALEEYLKERSQ